jgi:hypothetical protein
MSIKPAPTEGSALPPLFVSSRDVARLCGLSLASWHWRVAADDIDPAPVLLGGRVLWRVEELRECVRCGCPLRRDWESMEAVQRNSRF